MRVFGVNMKGKFWPQGIASIDEDEFDTADEGRLVYDEGARVLYYGGSTKWIKATSVGDLFNLGQKIIWASQPLPDGWNIDTEFSDKVILTTDTGSEVGDTGGTWFIDGMNGSGDHNHYAPGGVGTSTINVGRGTSEIYYSAPWYNHRHDINDSGTHTHTFDGTWRPANVQFIVGVYEG